jgi:transposase-like protein
VDGDRQHGHWTHPKRGDVVAEQACKLIGICENTLSTWRKQYPGLQLRLEAAREEHREKLLGTIEAAADKDWRAAVKWLKLTFPEYR